MKHKKIYIIGIEGAGTSALAQIYRGQGHHVSGSDDGDGFYRKALTSEGIVVHGTFAAEHIVGDEDMIVYSTACSVDNVEIVAAQSAGVEVFSYPEAIGFLTREMYTVAVCGTHGKTTTTSMTAHAFLGAGRDVSAVVGAPVIGWEGGARCGSGPEFILEADEYQNKLALYNPQAAIVTSVDYDHPDFFPDFATYKKSFADFVCRIPRTGFLVAYHDDKDVLAVIADATCRVVTYGEDENADAVLTHHDSTGGDYAQTVRFTFENEQYECTVSLPGKHNALNAMAAWIMTYIITGQSRGASDGIAAYKGVTRRFEIKGMYGGALLLDDYAHHPEEIRTTLATLKNLYPQKKMIAAFHPHTYTRTKALLHEFARTLDIADQVIILDIYGSAREECGGVSAQDVVDAINQGAQNKAQNIADIDALTAWAKANLTHDDVFITLGAGDVYKVHEDLV